MKLTADLIVENTSAVLTMAHEGRPLTGRRMSELGFVLDGAVAARKGQIVWVGPRQLLKREVQAEPACTTIDAGRNAVLPGFVDPHTHLVFAGTREDEFNQKIAGVSYMEIAARGGGIKRSVRTTRETSLEDLVLLGRDRIRQALLFGTTCIEIKSGYGLDTETEIKILRAASTLKREYPVEIARTFLGAHEVPPDREKSAYLEEVCRTMIPRVARENLAEFCDVFCEKGVFTVAESHKVLSEGKKHGLMAKIHADQMSNIGASRLAGQISAISADHLDYTDDTGIAAMRSAGTIGVLLPGAVFFLGLKQYPPARHMIESGLPVALATDFNPGSCMTLNFPLIMTIAAVQCRMTIPEILSACTVNAAFSIGKQKLCGSIEPGKRADIIVLDTPSYEMIPYHFGHNHVRHVICKGRWVVRNSQYHPA